MIENSSYPNKKIEKAAKNTVTKLHKENKRFFFNVGSNKEITFFFSDLANNKKETYITMPSERFISHILIHLPSKNFKIVNRYGFYSRHISDKLKLKLF
ncbi:transposase [uncultured Leptotrichia sp.]|uniref:transposase n=1 Tax=uncultured Leptotrichia sp. TaxID=159271 RepID=UPI00345BCB61